MLMFLDADGIAASSGSACTSKALKASHILLAIGTPNQPLFDIPVGEGRAGLIVTGGLNPIAALCEAGVPVTFQSLAEVEDIARFSDFNARSQQFRG